jgi:hypothetical protein
MLLDPTSVFSSEERRVSSTIALVGAVAGVVVAMVMFQNYCVVGREEREELEYLM